MFSGVPGLARLLQTSPTMATHPLARSSEEYGLPPADLGRWEARMTIAAVRMAALGSEAQRDELRASGDLPPAPQYATAGAYVAACGRINPALRGHSRGGTVDGRLVAAGWNRCPPREWVGSFAAFRAWWNAAVARPDIIGSSHNNLSPEAAGECFLLGLRPGQAIPDCWLRQVRNRDGRVVPRRVRAVLRLRRSAWAPPSHVGVRTLERLAALGSAFLSVAWATGHRVLTPEGRVDWAAVEAVQALWTALPRTELRALGIPSRDWIEALRPGSGIRDVLAIRAGYGLAGAACRCMLRKGHPAEVLAILRRHPKQATCWTAWQAVLAASPAGIAPPLAKCMLGQPPPDGVTAWQPGWPGPGSYTEAASMWPLIGAAWLSLPLAALAVHLVPVCCFGLIASTPEGEPGQYLAALQELHLRGFPAAQCRWIGSGDAVPLRRLLKAPWAKRGLALAGGLDGPSTYYSVILLGQAAEWGSLPVSVHSWDEAREWADALLAAHGQAQPGGRSPASDRSRCRARDRLAQQDPAWAIQAYPHEYARGRRIAPVLRAVIDEITTRLETRETVLVHGRDGELLFRLLQRRGTKGDLRYAVTSRPLTTGGSGGEAHEAYLARVLPREVPAVHVDTGFAGSIPRWMATRGWTVRAIRMVSATSPAEQFSQPSEYQSGLRDLVLGDLEHAAQRHELPTAWPGLSYAEDSPGFWARLYGVEAVLGGDR
jgi:hypothetical protein